MKIMKEAKQKLRILYHIVSKVKIPLLVVCVGQACTLKCRDCSNFSPYAKKERFLYPVDDVLNDLKNILSVSKYIDLLQIQGGEPLIYPSMENILNYVISNNKIKHVHIATNGTVIPYKYLELLKNKKITVRISNYKVVDQDKVDKLCGVFEDNNIKYSLYSFTGGDNRWILQGGVNTTRENNDAIVADRFAKCTFSHCLTLENGMLGKCSRCIHAADVQNFLPKSDDYVVVREKHLRRRLHKYYDKCSSTKKYFMEACRYCYGTAYGEKVEPAIQISDIKRVERENK